jgi:hypothetical protein
MQIRNRSANVAALRLLLESASLIAAARISGDKGGSPALPPKVRIRGALQPLSRAPASEALSQRCGSCACPSRCSATH